MRVLPLGGMRKAVKRNFRQKSLSRKDNGLPEVGGVVLKDGSRLLYLLDGGQIGYQDDTHAYEISSFDRVIDVDQVQSLLFRIHAGDSPEKYVSVDLK